MKIPSITRFAKRRWHAFQKQRIDRFLGRARGVVHVGASCGQEADTYARHDLPVLWVEPIPEVFTKLCERIRGYPKQTAVQALVTDTFGRRYTFNVASNGGMSSSILGFANHTEIFPDIRYERQIEMQSTTLDALLAGAPNDYDALCMDVQGVEDMVIRGADQSMRRFRFVKMETSRVLMYEGGLMERDAIDIMARHGFRPKCSRKHPASPMRDMVFERHSIFMRTQ